MFRSSILFTARLLDANLALRFLLRRCGRSAKQKTNSASILVVEAAPENMFGCWQRFAKRRGVNEEKTQRES